MSASAATLVGLPTTIFSRLCLFSSCSDLVCLIRTCKVLRSVFEPILWSRVEWLPCTAHETSTIARSRDGTILHRPQYQMIETTRPDQLLERCQLAAQSWFNKLSQLHSKAPSRTQELCAHTRFLSAPIGNLSKGVQRPDDVCAYATLSYFSNLVVLELTVDWQPHKSSTFSVPAPGAFPKLSRIKLYGYVPQQLVQCILSDSSPLQDIDIGLLDEPIPGEEYASRRLGSPVTDDVQQNNLDVDDLMLFPDNVAPRPLVWFPDAGTSFPFLSYLRLCRPTEMDPSEFVWGRIHHSVRAEVACLEGWARLLEVVSPTIQHLVLDQRPVAHEDALEGGSSDEFMRFYSQPSSRRSLDMLGRLLREVEFPCLSRIDLAGVLTKEPLSSVDEQLRLHIVDLCHEKQIALHFSLSKRCIFYTEDGVVYSGEGMGAESL